MGKKQDIMQGLCMRSTGVAIPFHQRIVESETIQTVDGRDLYRELGLKDEGNYSRWGKSQIDRAYLIENMDAWVYFNHEVNPKGGRPTAEYYFTVDAAKHIAMMSATPAGRAIREYFIAAEKEWRRIERQQVIQEKFLLPAYDHDAEPLYPAILFEELCRVWGFPKPQGSRHSPGCRGIVHRDINGILPNPVQDVLFDEVENPYRPDGKTRQERHWRRLVEPQRKEVITPRIETILETCFRCDDNTRDKYKADLFRHDQRRGIVIRLSPSVQLRLGKHPEGQLLLFNKEEYHVHLM